MQLDWKHFLNESPISISDQQQEQLKHLYALLLEWNKLHNLTRLTEEHDFLCGHLLDSLMLSKAIQLHNPKSLLDIGAGAGFPSIPLAIVFPDMRVTALDSIQKKTRFIETIQTELKLENLSVLTGRAEDFAHSALYREQFDMVTARAVAALPVLLELAIGYVKPGGCFVAMKTQQAMTLEKPTEPEKLSVIGVCSAVNVLDVSLDRLLPDRCLVMISKNGPTQALYPRKMAHIKKNPLYSVG